MGNNIINDNIFKKAIHNVVAFFDMFDHPLTFDEVHRMLGINCRLVDVIEAIENMEKISRKNGFVFLPNRDEIIETRMKRYNTTDQKFKKALRVLKIFKIIPWIKMIAVANMIGAHNYKEDSDIDLFIITKKNRLWLTRFFCASFIAIFRLRPRPGKEKDKICLSFFISEDNLNLKNLRLDDNDYYFIYWLANLVPVYDDQNALNAFYQANDWLREYLPNWEPSIISFRRELGALWRIGKFLMIFGGLEEIAKKIQMKMFPKRIKDLMNKDTRVIVSDRILKFHVNDGRREYNRRIIW